MSHAKSVGMSLIELMVALLLSSCLISLVFEMYIANKQSLQLQNNLRAPAPQLAIELLTSSIKQAGYMGCERLINQSQVISHVRVELSPKNKVIGDANSFKLRYATFTGVILQKLSKNLQTLSANNYFNFTPHEIIMISDCKHAELASIKSVYQLKNQQKITLQAPLANHFDSGAEIDLFNVNHFFIKKTKRSDENNQPIYALYVENIHHQTQELVEGICLLNVNYLMQDGSLQTEISDASFLSSVAIKVQSKNNSFEKNWFAYAALS